MLSGTPSSEPEPATRAALAAALARLRAGDGQKPVIEQLLLELGDESAEALMLLIKEGRGAWLPLIESAGGRALFIGNGFSGTPVPLQDAGFTVTVLDPQRERAAFARERLRRGEAPSVARSDARGEPWALAASPERLPFRDACFDLVVYEQAGSADRLPSVAELARVTRGELVVCADNRLGYKRSGGRRGKWAVPGPVSYLEQVLHPRRGERSLPGYRRAFGAHFAGARAFALYPHAHDFSHVVSLDAPRPRLTIGPRERRNVVKMSAHALGLFPVFAPSFAIVGRRSPKPGRPRIAALLAALAERIDEPTPRVDLLVATRSDTALVLTECARLGGQDPRGRWALHLPLSARKRALVATHHGFLAHVRERFPALPVPEPLFAGELEGVWVAAERRLPGLTAPHHTGNLDLTRRMFEEVAERFSALALGPAEPFREQDFETWIAPRFELVARHCAVDSTHRALEAMQRRVRELLVGQPLPFVLHHGDLRAKHVQVDVGGSLLGILDWGASERRFLPYHDLLHLIGHQRKQEEECAPTRIWELIRDPRRLRPHEREALDAYADRLQLGNQVREALALAYPVLVTAMAERNWAWSRPRWIHRQYGV